MDLYLFNALRGSKGLLADFHRWRRRRLGRSVAWQPCLLRARGCDPAAPAPHHCLLCFCSSFQLQPSRKATGGAGDEEGKGEWAMPQVRLLGEKQGLLDPQDLSPHHGGSQTAGILSHSRVSSITVSDLQCRKENIHTLCSPYSPAFHTCTFEIPFTSSFPSTLCIWHILSCLHPQIHNPPSLAGERETFPCCGGVRGKACAQGDATSVMQVLCVLTDFAGGFCSSLSQTWYWQMLCKLPTQRWQGFSHLTRDHRPSRPLFPLPPSPGQRLS